jgi:hypothetical protein
MAESNLSSEVRMCLRLTREDLMRALRDAGFPVDKATWPKFLVEASHSGDPVLRVEWTEAARQERVEGVTR